MVSVPKDCFAAPHTPSFWMLSKKTRYTKNEAQLFSLFGLANLVIAKRSLLRVAARGAS